MRKEPSFTLVELLIAIALMTVLAGIGSKLWIGMERMAKTCKQNIGFSVFCQTIFERIGNDIDHSIELSQSPGALLAIEQRQANGEIRRVVYSVSDQELIRTVTEHDGNIHSRKIASVDNQIIEVTMVDNGLVKLEIIREGRNQPMNRFNRHYITYVMRSGAI